MRIFGMFLCIALILTGCLPRAMQPPISNWESFRKPTNKKITSEMIKQDMLICGFDSPYTTYIASNDEFNTQYINAILCMENKGYQRNTLPKGVCYRYADKPACQAYRQRGLK
ncbi:hypothetical protein [Moraxella marmotae]|uniref:hypothetical protein n=1 Tax=Moraxella marmotae TaxID=3344520 RepID=UPI0035F42B31